MTVSRPRGRHLAGAVLAAGLSVLLGACGGGADAGDAAGDTDSQEIPSLATDPAATDGVPEAPERPLIRSDTSPEEEERLWGEYERCLEENGGLPAPGGGVRGDVGEPVAGVSAEDEAEILAAEAACEHMLPERLWERSQRTDPEYPDRLREWVTCIRSHGIDAWEDDGFLAFESLPPEHEMAKVHECEEKAFA